MRSDTFSGNHFLSRLYDSFYAFREDSSSLKMTSATGTSCVSPGTIISVLSVFLYCAGFVRVEWKLYEQNSRITVLERKPASEDHLVHEDGKMTLVLKYLVVTLVFCVFLPVKNVNVLLYVTA